MKKKSLVLSVLMIIPLLGGCKNQAEKLLKPYGHKVEIKKFITKLQDAYEKSTYFKYVDYEAGFDFNPIDRDFVYEYKLVEAKHIVSKMGKAKFTRSTDGKQTARLVYDDSKQTAKVNASSKYVEIEDSGEKEVDTLKQKEKVFVRKEDGKKERVEVDFKSKAYSSNDVADDFDLGEYLSEGPSNIGSELDNFYTLDADAVAETFKESEDSSSETETSKYEFKQTTQCYIDGNTFTYETVIKTKNEQKYETYNLKSEGMSKLITQFVIRKNLISYITVDTEELTTDRENEKNKEHTAAKEGYSESMTVKFKHTNVLKPNMKRFTEGSFF